MVPAIPSALHERSQRVSPVHPPLDSKRPPGSLPSMHLVSGFGDQTPGGEWGPQTLPPLLL